MAGLSGVNLALWRAGWRAGWRVGGRVGGLKRAGRPGCPRTGGVVGWMVPNLLTKRDLTARDPSD